MTSLGINAYSQLKFAVSLAISQKLSSLLGSPGLKLGLSLSMKRIFSLRRLSTDGPWTVFLSVFLFFYHIVRKVESVEAVPSCICNEKSIKSPVSSYDLFFKKKKGRAKSHFTYLPSSLSFSLIFPFPYTKSVYEDCKPEALKENSEGLWTLMRKQITPLFSPTYNWNSSFPSIIGQTTDLSGISSTHDCLQ